MYYTTIICHQVLPRPLHCTRPSGPVCGGGNCDVAMDFQYKLTGMVNQYIFTQSPSVKIVFLPYYWKARLE